jgi:hypothetical protein
LLLILCIVPNSHLYSTEEKQALKRERENARYEQHKEGILQSLCEKRRRAKSTAVLRTGEQTQPDIGDAAVSQLHHTRDVECLVS